MAITRKAEAIQQTKTVLRCQIAEAYDECEQVVKKIPRFVRNGSHQVALKWRTLAEDALNATRRGPAKASVAQLQEELAARRLALHALNDAETLKKLTEVIH